MTKRVLWFLLLAPFALGAPPQTPGPCEPPLPVLSARDANIFSESQEVDLGDAIAEHVQSSYRVIDNNEITGYLTRIGERLVRHLPPNRLQFRFFLVDLPDANAFVLPGGRIYVSRKLVGFARSEDELAGVIAHEIGHLVARQQTIAISRQMKEALRVTEVKDRNDIFDKYHRLIESEERNPRAFRANPGHEGQEQIAADRIGLFAAAGAGYDPSAMSDFWDRLVGTKGKTGSFFSDFFGNTAPEVKRFREMIKTLGTLPAQCVEARSSGGSVEYRAWQAAVITYSGPARKEFLHGVLSRTLLDPALRGEVTHLRFSPDGRRLLAQDDSGINVLSREPFVPLFRIPATNVSRARFTPDSQGVVFHNADLRVEHWSAIDGKLKEAHELVIRVSCLQTALAPDGSALACLDQDFTLNVFDVATGETLFQKKGFYAPSRLTLLEMADAASVTDGLETENASLLDMEFSTDGRFFVAAQRGALPFANSVAWDARTRSALALTGAIQRLIVGGFIFNGPDTLLAYNIDDPKKSALIALPRGEIVSRLSFFPGKLTAVTRGNYVLSRSTTGTYPITLLGTDKGVMVKANELPALDVYADTFVSERPNGELGLYTLEKNELQAVTELPGNLLGPLRAVTVSPDLAWLAVSDATRGSAWDLGSGKRVLFVRGFRNGFIANDGILTADFPRFREAERQLARIDLKQTVASLLRDETDTHIKTYGELRLTVRPAKKGGRYGADVIFEMQDERTLQSLWVRSFPNEAPGVWVEPVQETMVLLWGALSRAAQAEIKGSSALAERFKNLKERNDYLLEVVDLRTGKIKGRLAVETGKGSFEISAVLSADDWVVITDDRNRVLVYSLASGEKIGQVFGGRAAISAPGGLIAVENEDGQLTLYDLATLKKRDEFSFSRRVAFARFSADGKRLLVLTGDQIAYVLDVSSSVRND